MKKINIIFIVLFLGITMLPMFRVSAATSDASKSYCEIWTDDKGSDHNGKVCTDLLEGIPKSTISPPSECYDVMDSTRPNKDPNTCYALISPTGIAAFMSFIAMIYRYGSWAIGILAVLVIIIGGITMSIGGASQESVTKGKKLIFQAIGGVILFFLIGVILHTINPNFF